MTYHRVRNMRNMTCLTCEAGTEEHDMSQMWSRNWGTWHVSHVKQELKNMTYEAGSEEHDMSHMWSRNCLPFGVDPRFYWGSCCSIFSFLCCVNIDHCFPLSIDHCIVCLSVIYGFWLPFDILYLRLLITLWYLRFTVSNYLFGILDIRLLITFWYLRFTASDYLLVS